MKRIIVVSLFLLLTVINLITLKSGHHWGDFAQYIINAKNILEHRPYLDGILVSEVNIVYPPGFPLMIAPLIKVFGVNFIVLKAINVACWCFYIYFAYLILIRFFDRSMAVLFCLGLASSFYFFMFKQGILSDVPFAFLATATLYFFLRYDEDGALDARRFKYFILGCIFLALSCLTRAAGFVLFLSILMHLLAFRRNWKAAIVIVGTWALTMLTQNILTQGPHLGLFQPSVVQKIAFSDLGAGFSFINSFAMMIKGLVWSLFPPKLPMVGAFFHWASKASSVVGFFLYGGFVWLFIRDIKERRSILLGCFLFFYTMMLLLWTVFGDTPEQFARYMLPLWMPVFVMAARLLTGLSLNLVRGFLVIVIVFNVLHITMFYKFDDDKVNATENKELFQWMRESLHPDDHYMFPDDPRPVALLTERTGTTMWMVQRAGRFELAQLIEKIQSFKITYWILSKAKDQEAMELLSSKLKWPMVWENNRYVVFKIQTH